MKTMRKFFALFLAMMMVLAMGTTAFAADNGNGSITIENATIGVTYKAYRVFDATISDERTIAYTIDATSQFYKAVANGSGTPFELTQIGETDKYNVSVKSGYSDTDILNWLQNVAFSSSLMADFETKATKTELEWNNVPYGYYLIESGIGATITVTNTNPNAVVHDKNQKPGWTTPDGSGPDAQAGKNVSNQELGDYSKETTASNGDTVYYSLTAFAPKYNGNKIVNQYVFEDELGKGIELDPTSIVVEANGNMLYSGSDYYIDTTSDGFKITVDVHNNMNYPENANLTIKYQAKLTCEDIYDRENTASMTWTEFEPSTTDPSVPQYPGSPVDPDPSDTPADSKADVYVYGFRLQKYKETVAEGNKLEGAEFKLYAEWNPDEALILVCQSDGTYFVTDNAQNPDATEVIEAGYAKIFGLKEGTYYLEETKAPDGYNGLTQRVEIQVASQFDPDQDGFVDEEVAVINNAGVILPETGGIGTTIFYVVGGLLMAGAVILLITRKKMSASED